jgi:alanine dehydrogenase
MALTNVTLPYVTLLADQGPARAIEHAPELALGVNVVDGQLTSRPVAESLGLPHSPLRETALR